MNSADLDRRGGDAKPTRRGFLHAAVASAGTMALCDARATADETVAPGQEASTRQQIDEYDDANTKVAHVVPSSLSDQDILFLKQIGLRWVIVSFSQAESTLEKMQRTQERFAQQGIRIYGGWNYAYRSLKIQLGQPGRDEDIREFQAFLRNLGRLGVPVAPYDFHPANTYTTAFVETRGYTAREFSVDDFRAKVEKNRFDREYSADDIWSYYTYFLKAVLPVAEESNVRLALHPDDPPLAKMNGVAKLFTHYDGYHRAEEVAASSRHWGLTLCVGTWSEGGGQMGKDVFEMIRDFGGRGRIHLIHFRNVSSPLPRFHETFPDDGYQDMFQVMKALREVRYAGCVVPDHIPKLAGDDRLQRAGLAYCVAYTRALLRRANAEVG
jgi:mannonate dehydratase